MNQTNKFMSYAKIVLLSVFAMGFFSQSADALVFGRLTTANGLGSNTVYGVFVDGSTVYAATSSGLSIATNGLSGSLPFVNRTVANSGIASNTVNGAFASGSNVYAATTSGLSISTNGGTNFTGRTTAQGLGNNYVNGVFVSGSNVYAATNGGLSISTNDGASFTNKTTTNGLGGNTVRGVFVDGTTVYAATSGGLSISTNGGASFVTRTTSQGLGSNNVYSVWASGTTVYVGTGGGLSLSTNGGTSFTNKTTANGLGSNSVYAVYASGTTVYAGGSGGLGISTNSGESFTKYTTTTNPGQLGSNTINGVFFSGNTLYAGTGNGLSYSPPPPSATTNTASDITLTSATLNGTVNDNGADTSVTFDYGPTTGYGATTAGGTVAANAGSTGVAGTLSGLSCNTLYHFRVSATNSAGTTNGGDATFTTAPCPPSATTNAASAITLTGATLNGTVNDNGADTTVTFDYGPTTGYGATTAGGTVAANAGNTDVSGTLSGLACNTLYHFRVSATNSSGTTNGSDAMFTTSPCHPDSPTALMATPGDSQAVIAFTAPASDGGSAITNYEYSTDNGTNWTARLPAATTSPVTITGLTNGMTYQIKLRAINNSGAGAASTAVSVTPTACGAGLALTTGAGALWQQLALPCVPTTATVQGALGSGATGNLLAADYNSGSFASGSNWWRLYSYNASTPGYELPLIGDAVSVGTGYWIKSFDAPVGGGNLTVSGTATPAPVTSGEGCASANGCGAVPLTVIPILAGSRYQLIGNPFPYNVDWAKVRIRVGGAVYTPSQAAGLAANGNASPAVLSNQIWIWNGTNYDNWDDITNPGKLQYFQSFWVKMLPGAAGKNLELLIPAEMSPQSRLDADPARALAVAPLPWYLAWLDWVSAPARAADSEWQVRLGVENRVTGWKDTTNLVGQKLTAQTGYDAHDLIGMAPFATPYLSLVLPHPEWPATADGQKRAGDYDTDFRPAQCNPVTTWSFELRGSPTGGRVFLTWQGDPAILKRSRLIDLQTGQTLDPTATAYAQGYPVVLRQKVQRYQWRFSGQ